MDSSFETLFKQLWGVLTGYFALTLSFLLGVYGSLLDFCSLHLLPLEQLIAVAVVLLALGMVIYTAQMYVVSATCCSNHYVDCVDDDDEDTGDFEPQTKTTRNIMTRLRTRQMEMDSVPLTRSRCKKYNILVE